MYSNKILKFMQVIVFLAIIILTVLSDYKYLVCKIEILI